MWIKLAALLLVSAHFVLGAAALARWYRSRPRPDRQADFRTLVSYWLPKLIVAQLHWLLSATASFYLMVALVYPALHRTAPPYFIQALGLALALSLIMCVVLNALVVVHLHRTAQRREALGGSHPLD